MRTIGLTHGKVALVDDADFAPLAAHKWYAQRDSAGQWYAVRRLGLRVNRRLLLMHKEIMQPPTGMVVVHWNGNRLDNRRSNLVLRTHSELNHVTSEPRGSSRYKGVHWCKANGRWCAAIAKDYRWHYLGYFDDEDEAARAYNEAARKLYGEIAYQNVISEGGRG